MEMIYGEVQAFLHACTAGVFLRALYGLIRMKRALFPGGKILQGVEDLLYWLFATGMLFALWQEYFRGISRGYGYLAVFLGMYLCYKGPERLVLKVFVKYVADPLKKRRKAIKLKSKMRRKEAMSVGPEDKSESESA